MHGTGKRHNAHFTNPHLLCWQTQYIPSKDCAGRRLDPQSDISRQHVALYTPNMENSLLSEYMSQVTKRNKRRKKKRMHCVARVSIKFKAIFRAHRFVLIVTDHHQWTPNEEVIIRW